MNRTLVSPRHLSMLKIRKIARWTACLGLLALLASAPELTAQTFSLQGKLFPSDTTGTDGFGRRLSLSADGNTALVGALKGFADCRRARVFQRSASVWIEEAVLQPTTPAPQGCGYPVVALSGDGQTAWVQDWANEEAHVFTRSGTTWLLHQVLPLPDGLSGGSTPDPMLSYDGNAALLGAPNHDPPGCELPPTSSCGAGFVYVRLNGTWSLEQQLVAPVFEPDANLGTGVALSGDGQTALLGDRFVNGSRGAAYMFTRSGSTWTFQQKLEAPDGADGDDFGQPLALSHDGGAALIGSGGHCHGPSGCSTRYLYAFDRTGTTFTFQQELPFQSDYASSVMWGDLAMAGSGERAVLGIAREDCVAGEWCGAAVFFGRGASGPWTQIQRLVGVDGDAFGSDVGISADGSTALIGASTEDCILGPYCGAAYAFVDKCPPGVFAVSLDCSDEQLPHEWLFMGCEVVDCCPWCPGSTLFRIDWVIRYAADPSESAILRFDNLSAGDISDLEMRGPGTWLEGNMLKMSGGSEVILSGFEVQGKGGLRLRADAPRMALDRISAPREEAASRFAAPTRSGRLTRLQDPSTSPDQTRVGRATLTLEQRVDGRVIDRSTVVYVFP